MGNLASKPILWLLLLGPLVSPAQTNTTQLNDQARIRQDIIGYWANHTRLENGTMVTNAIFLRGDGLWAFVSKETERSGAYGGTWHVRGNSLVLVKTRKIAKGTPELRTMYLCLTNVFDNTFEIVYTNRLQDREIETWHRSLSATQAISRNYELKENEIVVKSIR